MYELIDQSNEEQQEKLNRALYVMDTMCVGDSTYHEFSILSEGGLPKSYLVKQRRSQLNSTFAIERTPGVSPGVQVSFTADLSEKILHALKLNVDKALWFLETFSVTTESVREHGL